MYDFVKYLQEKLDSISSGSYIVSSERNLNSRLEKIEVVVSALSAQITDKEATDIPYELEIITSDIMKVMADFTILAKNYSNVAYTEIYEGELVTITPFFNTPTVLDKDIQSGSQHYSKIVVFASVNEKTGVNNIKKLTIVGEETIELLSGSLSYSAELCSDRVSGQEITKSKKNTASCSLTFMAINKNTPFFNKAFKISVGALNGNTPFQCKIELDNGITAQLNLIINAYSLNVERTKLPSVNISMVPYNTIGD